MHFLIIIYSKYKNKLKNKEKERSTRKKRRLTLDKWGVLPQVGCCCNRSEWRVKVELLEQVVPVLIIVLLVLLDVGDGVFHVRLPLRVLVQGVVNVLLCFFNGGQPSVEVGMIHLLVKVAHMLIMIAMGRERHTSILVAA